MRTDHHRRRTCPTPITLTWDHDGLRPIAQTERMLTADDRRRTRSTAASSPSSPTWSAPPPNSSTRPATSPGAPAATLWGTTAWTADSTAYTPLRFPGQYYDPETGLHYNYHRYYDPETARYLTPDPLGLAPAPNPVAYVHNPTWVDPLGLCMPRGRT